MQTNAVYLGLIGNTHARKLLIKFSDCRIKDEPHILRQVRGGLLREEVVQAQSQLQGLRSCLAPLLALRRQTCPRLFLLPDTDLLHLLTRGEVSTTLQIHK